MPRTARALADGDLSRWMHWLLTAHVRRYQRHYHATGHVWQGRFKAFPIPDDDHLLVVLRYVERNPLHAGLVGRAEAWGVVQPPRPRPRATGPLAGSGAGPPRPAVGGGGKCPDLRDRVGPHPPQPPAALHRSVPKLGPCRRPSPWVWNPASNLLVVRGRRPTKARESRAIFLRIAHVLGLGGLDSSSSSEGATVHSLGR